MVIAALLLSVLAFAGIAGAADPPRGAMKVPGGGAPCIRDRTAPASYASCPVVANGLQGAMTAVVSPDGKNVYVTGFQSDSVASFSRDESTGALTPLPGAAACMKDRTSTAGAQCGSTAIGIKVAIGLAISPDGKSVYVAGVGSDAVAAFSRNPDTGALTQLPGAGACIKNETAAADNPCPTSGKGLAGTRWVTVSADGRNVYTATAAGHAIAAFKRDTSTGALTQLPGAGACIEDVTDNIPGSGVPDGTGKESCPQRANGMAYPRTITLSPDGKNAYTATDFGGAIAEFKRDPSTGALTQLRGADECIKDTLSAPGYTHCPQSTPSLNWAWQVAVAPDGANVYASSDEGMAVTSFSRDPATGALHPLPGAGACIREWNAPQSTQCRVSGNGLAGAEGISVSPDSHTIYIAAFHGMAVSAFSRDPGTGALTQLPGGAGCIEDSRAPHHTTSRCDAKADGLYQPRMVALSPDGRNAYVPSSVGSTLTVISVSGKGAVLHAKPLTGAGGKGSSSTASKIGIAVLAVVLLVAAAALLAARRRGALRRRGPRRKRRSYYRM